MENFNPEMHVKIQGGYMMKPIENPEITVITPDAMRDRFTFEERVLIKSSNDMRVQTFYDDLSLRKKPVDLKNPRFGLAMQLLLAENLIEPGREIALLSNGKPYEAA